MPFRLVVFLIAILFSYSFCSAIDRVSQASGNFGVAGTWSPSGIPGPGDNLTISASHIVTVAANGSCNSLTVNGTLGCSANNRTINASGGLTINNGGTINGSSTGILNVAGTMTIPSSASATIGRFAISISGASAINGTVTFNSAAGAKTFTGDVTIASTGVWNVTAAIPFGFNGNFINNGVLTANTGTYTFGGATKTISGTGAIIFNDILVSGTYTNNTTIQVNVNIAATGGLTQGANATLIIGDPSPTGNLTATASGNTVRYLISSGNQSVYTITYNNLVFDNTGTGSIDGKGTYTLNGNLDVLGGIAEISNITINGNINISSGATLNVSWSPVINGTTTINGTLAIIGTPGTKTFGNVIVNAGGTWNVTVVEGAVINGNLSNSGTFTANTGVYTLAGAVKTISGTISIPNTTVTGSYTNNATFTSTASLLGSGTFTQGATGTLNLGIASANFTVTTFNASASGNTVNYTLAGAQNVRLPSDGSYNHLGISGTGTKTLLGATDVNGNLTINSTLATNNFNITLGGNWTNLGVFTAGTGTVTFDGSSSQIIGGIANTTYNNLTLSTAQTRTIADGLTTTVNGSLTWTAGDFSVGSTAASTLTLLGGITIPSTYSLTAVSSSAINLRGNWTNNGSFAYNTSTVTFNGSAAQTVGGTTITDFYNITQSNAVGVSLTQNQNLINALTISAGTFTTTGFAFTLKSTSSLTARIAAIPAGANIAGNITMERYTGTGPWDWRFLSSPVSGKTIADWADDFPTSGFTGSNCPPTDCATCGNTCNWPSIWWYDETQPGNLDTFGFVAATNVTDPIVSGRGYWVFLGPTPVTFEVTGAPYTFSEIFPVAYTNSGSIDNDGWNLVTNQYPSAIDWRNLSNWTKTNIDSAVYIYNSYTGTYASYASGVGVNGGSRYIASSQAFWVKANAASPVLSKVENAKASPDPSFLKTAITPNTSKYPMAFKDFPIPLNTNNIANSIKLTASGNGREDETFIRFMPGATNNFDGSYDAWKFISLDSNAHDLSSVMNDSLDYSINSLSDLISDVTIPIRLTKHQLTIPFTGTFSIRRDSILMLPMSSCVFLEDLVTGSIIDLRTNISYSFTFSDTAAAPRFLLHIYEPILKGSISAVCSGDSNGAAIAQGTGAGPWNYVWKDSSGNILKTTNSISSADTLFNLSAGIYTVEVSGGLCGTLTDTIIVNAVSNISLSQSQSNVSCFGMNDGVASVIPSGGVAPYNFLWNTGSSTSSISNIPAGNYSVVVIDGNGCSALNAITITEPLQVVSSFITDKDTVDLSINNSVVFTNTSVGSAYYFWTFGDSSQADTLQNPVHYFSYSGIYNVTLISSNGSCYDTAYMTIVVVDSILTPVSVDESASLFSDMNVLYDGEDIYLEFNLDKEKNVDISVYDLLGSRVVIIPSVSVFKSVIKLPVNNFSAGMYVSVADMQDAILVRKVLIPAR